MCKFMRKVEELKFLSYKSLERIKSIVCGELCNGSCNEEYWEKRYCKKPENASIDDIIKKIVDLIFDGKVNLDNPSETVEELKEWLHIEGI